MPAIAPPVKVVIAAAVVVQAIKKGKGVLARHPHLAQAKRVSKPLPSLLNRVERTALMARNMNLIAQTPKPPYYAVIFTSQLSKETEGHEEMAERMVELAATQPGFLGYESAREELGITVSYWSDLNAIKSWKNHAEHLVARTLGRRQWYAGFKVRICKVERDYE